jgi:hypothetical protein
VTAFNAQEKAVIDGDLESEGELEEEEEEQEEVEEVEVKKTHKKN